MTEFREKWYPFLGRKVTALMAGGVCLGIFIFAVELTFIYLLQVFFASMGLLPAGPPGFFSTFSAKWIISLFLAVGILRAGLLWLQNYAQAITFEIFILGKRKDLLRWVYSQGSASAADVNLFFNQYITLSGTALQSVQLVLISFSTAFLLGLSLFKMAPLTTCAVVAALGLLTLPLKGIDRKIKATSRKAYDQMESAHWRLMAGVKNLLLIQIYGTQDKEIENVEHAMGQFSILNLKNAKTTYFKAVLPQGLGVIVVCILALTSKKMGELSSVALVPYLYLFLRLAQNATAVFQGASLVSMGAAPLEKLMNWHLENQTLLNRSDMHNLPHKKNPVEIRSPFGWSLQDITFIYPHTKSPVLQNFSLNIQPGATTVIQGPSGAGKTTVLGLLVGLFQPQEGKVEILSQEKMDLQKKDYLDHLGYVGPDSFWVEGTILDNLNYGLNGVATESEIKEVLDLADCRFIFEMPKGLGHFIEEQGQGLSAGQKQRLSLARALLRKPKALILDEPTSNLDGETEERLCKLFERLKGKMTLVIVTHRPALLRLADNLTSLKKMS